MPLNHFFFFFCHSSPNTLPLEGSMAVPWIPPDLGSNVTCPVSTFKSTLFAMVPSYVILLYNTSYTQNTTFQQRQQEFSDTPLGHVSLKGKTSWLSQCLNVRSHCSSFFGNLCNSEALRVIYSLDILGMWSASICKYSSLIKYGYIYLEVSSFLKVSKHC